MQQSENEPKNQDRRPPEQVQVVKQSIPTHFKYLCRICGKETLEPVLRECPGETPVPTCCSGRRRDMAFKGGIMPQ